MLTVDETALLCWRLLETQGKCGCPWETFKEVPDELKGIIPVERRILHKQCSTGEVLRVAYREYTESAAQKLQENIKFDVVEELLTKGYREAFKAFRRAIRSYYMSCRLAKWYAL